MSVMLRFSLKRPIVGSYYLLLIVFIFMYPVGLSQVDLVPQARIEREDDKLHGPQTIPLQKFAINNHQLAQVNNFNPTSQHQGSREATLPIDTHQNEDLDRFMFLKNFNRESDQQLANINNRASLGQYSVRHNEVKPKTKIHKDANLEVRSDYGMKYAEDRATVTKRGRVDDTNHELTGKVARGPSPTKSAYDFPVQPQPLFKPSNGLFGKLETNCIKRSETKVAVCEDHLIKRLNQDAREGRTAYDVERRVCCALFWHKDCVARMMLESCPDSSPAAADELMGSRRIDLTLSCQKFNRDGCNGATRSISYISIISWNFILISLIVRKLYNRNYHDN